MLNINGIDISTDLRAIAKTFSSPKKVYPTLATTTLLTCSAAAWTLGNAIEIVPINTITERFRIDYVSFSGANTAATYEVVFYKGLAGSEIEIGRTRVHPGAVNGAVIGVPLYTALIDANERISAKAASGNAYTIYASIVYHIDE